jgi:hypothetical protein
MAGLTAIINAIVRKVLAPARISVVGVVPWSDRRKRRLSIAGVSSFIHGRRVALLKELVIEKQTA